MQVSRSESFPRSVVCQRGLFVYAEAATPVTETSLLGQSPHLGCIPSSHKEVSFCSNHEILAVAFELGSAIMAFPDGAFSGATHLRSICIPSSVKSLGTFCFQAADNLAIVLFEKHSTVSHFGLGAFKWCASLQFFEIPASVEQIDQDCFGYCTRISFVTFQSNSKLRSLSSPCIFSNCYALRSIDIPSSVEAIGGGCFVRCDNLSVVRFAGDSRLTTLHPAAFGSCALLSEVVGPARLERLWKKLHQFESPDPSSDFSDFESWDLLD
jgi:hypothetical protein